MPTRMLTTSRDATTTSGAGTSKPRGGEREHVAEHSAEAEVVALVAKLSTENKTLRAQCALLNKELKGSNKEARALREERDELARTLASLKGHMSTPATEVVPAVPYIPASGEPIFETVVNDESAARSTSVAEAVAMQAMLSLSRGKTPFKSTVTPASNGVSSGASRGASGEPIITTVVNGEPPARSTSATEAVAAKAMLSMSRGETPSKSPVTPTSDGVSSRASRGASGERIAEPVANRGSVAGSAAEAVAATAMLIMSRGETPYKSADRPPLGRLNGNSIRLPMVPTPSPRHPLASTGLHGVGSGPRKSVGKDRQHGVRNVTGQGGRGRDDESAKMATTGRDGRVPQARSTTTARFGVTDREAGGIATRTRSSAAHGGNKKNPATVEGRIPRAKAGPAGAVAGGRATVSSRYNLRSSSRGRASKGDASTRQPFFSF